MILDSSKWLKFTIFYQEYSVIVQNIYSLLLKFFVFNCSFIQDTSVNPSIDFSNLFKIEPLHASLSPGEKAKAVSITFLARREITIQNQSLLKCQVSTLEILAIMYYGSIFLSAKDYILHIQYERYYTQKIKVVVYTCTCM